MASMGEVITAAAAVTLVGLVVTALWRLSGVLVHLPATLDRLSAAIDALREDHAAIGEQLRDHGTRLTHLEHLNGVAR